MFQICSTPITLTEYLKNVQHPTSYKQNDLNVRELKRLAVGNSARVGIFHILLRATGHSCCKDQNEPHCFQPLFSPISSERLAHFSQFPEDSGRNLAEMFVSKPCNRNIEDQLRERTNLNMLTTRNCGHQWWQHIMNTIIT